MKQFGDFVGYWSLTGNLNLIQATTVSTEEAFPLASHLWKARTPTPIRDLLVSLFQTTNIISTFLPSSILATLSEEEYSR